MCIFTSVSVKTLTYKVQELESKVVTEDSTVNLEESVMRMRPPMTEFNEDDDDKTIEEEPDFCSLYQH